jgi:hypothetical protein
VVLFAAAGLEDDVLDLPKRTKYLDKLADAPGVIGDGECLSERPGMNIEVIFGDINSDVAAHVHDRSHPCEFGVVPRATVRVLSGMVPAPR